MKSVQQNPARSFNLVGYSDHSTWKNIFAFLRKGSDEVRGRSEEGGPNLRRQLELFAKGQIPPEQLDDLCAEIATSPDAMETLARLLRKPGREPLE